METVSMMAAALKQSTNTESEAATAANNAVIDMADNASKMGSSMESIQTAYAGFSKQNYTMLDNLKLGYGGTKQEMERLLEDAEKLTGIHYDINQLDDVYAAIHAIQEDLGITGTTAEEAMHTIEGTANATKAAWQNVLTAIAGGGDLSEAMDSLVTAVFGDGSDGSGLLANIIPRIQATLEGIADFIGQAAPMFAERLPGIIEQLLPPLLEAVGALVAGLASAIPGILEGLWNILLDAGTQLVSQLGQGWQGGISTFISTIGDGMNTALTTVLAAIPQMLQAGIQIIQNISSGIVNGLPNVIAAISNVITQIVSTISTYGPQILAKGVEFITNLRTGFLQALPSIISGV
jgi:phage-related protein